MRLVPNAMWAPGVCMFCGGNEGEMVDTGLEIPGDGRMYICMRFCAPRIAALVTNTEPERICTAIKANGQPCSAKALPDRELCSSHFAVQQKKEEEEYVLVDVHG